MTDAVVVLEQRLQNSSATATLQLPLTAEERTVLRGRRTTSCGRPVLLQLPREGSLQPGDLLGDQSGSTVVEVTAAPEALLRVQGSHPLELLQAAYHLGNRHVATGAARAGAVAAGGFRSRHDAGRAGIDGEPLSAAVCP